MATTLGPLTSQPTATRIHGTAIHCYQFDTHDELARCVAQTLARVIRERNSFGQNAVLGLPTGSTPVGVYRELIRMHREEGLDFSGVVTFNLDEYFGIDRDRLQSYHRWMDEHFFNHVNIRPENIHIPDGSVALDEVDEHCRRYEEAIERAGGIDVQLLGIGRNGHIGFNEPFSPRNGRTRLAVLDPITRMDAASDFFSEEHVPASALTMGLGTILDARKVILLALGEHKAPIIREAVEGPLADRVPASYLREHPDASFLLDRAAAAQLTGVATPWLLGTVEWTDALIKRAVLWLAERTGKALLKLDDNDFRDHNLHQLLRRHGPAQRVAHRVFRWMMDSIEYHPAGRTPQRVICFSPHPDDDVISMGGTLIRLVEDGHEVHVAYMTSGNIAVFDHDASWLADLVTEYNRLFGIDQDKSRTVEEDVVRALASKAPGQPDSDQVLKIKALIRWGEAKAGATSIGCREEHLHFLDLPFYRTGTIAKRPVGDDDVRIVRELIERVNPGQVYLAGDLSDPHGTHRMCAQAIFRALDQIKADRGQRPDALMYRGAWQEWPVHEIEIAVPLSPKDLELKKAAIFRHESQKDKALFPGPDAREFWQRAEDRNRHTADVYNRIGLPEYFAMEGFVRWKGQWV
ncbi:MAG: glucosamine-6-phosphate deaminase [Pirellulales bacterium]|nr:glucosamine-6-phosphate deaminase [Pirellulales bacterium]